MSTVIQSGQIDNVDYMRILVIDQIYSIIEDIKPGSCMRWDSVRKCMVEFECIDALGIFDASTKRGRKLMKEFDFKTSRSIIEMQDNEAVLDLLALVIRRVYICM